jgi:hypothetical protein
MIGELFNMDRRDKANNMFSKLCECTYNATAVESMDLEDNLISSLLNSGCSVKTTFILQKFQEVELGPLCVPVAQTRSCMFQYEFPFYKSGIFKSSECLAKLIAENRVLSRYW